jgi:hypothetical protein
MRLTVARAALLATSLAGCLSASPAIECFEVTSAECEVAADAALPHFTELPARLVVAGTRPAFVVVGCTENAVVAIVDVLVAHDDDIDARVRGHSPNLSHLCDNDPPS